MSTRHFAARYLTVVLASLVACAAQGTVLHAQGANFLLLPVGARSVGAGEAAVADTLGADGVWWNPAALAAMSRSEVSLSGSQSFEGNNASIVYARPSRVLGTLAATANILDYGDQANTGDTPAESGTISVRSTILMVSYATAIGQRLRVGLNYKYGRFAFTCAGVCGPQSQFVGASSALDAGVQYVLPTKTPVTVGGAVRHLGPSFQVKDAEQADPLPRTWQAGVSARLPLAALDSIGVKLDVMTDLLGSLAYEGISVRFGGVATYQERYSLRGGYSIVDENLGGAAIGMGVVLSEGMVIDIARSFGGLSAQAGQAPTYVTLRFRF